MAVAIDPVRDSANTDMIAKVRAKIIIMAPFHLWIWHAISQTSPFIFNRMKKL